MVVTYTQTISYPLGEKQNQSVQSQYILNLQ